MTKPDPDVIDDRSVIHPPWAPDLDADVKWVSLDEDELMKAVQRLFKSRSEDLEGVRA